MRVLIVWSWLACVAVAAQAQVDAKAVLAEARELARAGRHGEAIDRYQGLATAVEAQLGGQSLALIFVLRELAEQHHALGDAAAAEPLYRRSLQIGEGNPEAERAMLVPSLRGLAALAAGRGQLMEAESLYLRSLEIQEQAFGLDHASVAVALVDLASLHDKQGRRSEAGAEVARAGTILDARCGPVGDASEPCRHALQVYREVADRLGIEPVASDPLSAPDLAAAAVGAETVVAGLSRVYRAQIGSRRDRHLAEKALEELRQAHPLISGLRFRIARADLEEKGVWYRIQLGEFPTGAQAQALCRELARLGHDGCFVTVTSD